MLIRDILAVIFSYLRAYDIKIVRLCCHAWDEMVRNRLNTLYTSNEIVTVPSHCDSILCLNGFIPELHDGIKKAIIYCDDLIWDYDIELLLVYASMGRFVKCGDSSRIRGKINKLLIGIEVDSLEARERKQFIEQLNYPEALVLGSGYNRTYDRVLITSHLPCRISTSMMKVFVIESDSQINMLVIGAANLFIYDLDAEIKSFYVYNTYLFTRNKICISINNGIERQIESVDQSIIKLDSTVWSANAKE